MKNKTITFNNVEYRVLDVIDSTDANKLKEFKEQVALSNGLILLKNKNKIYLCDRFIEATFEDIVETNN